MPEQRETFKTSELSLAAFLFLHGYKRCTLEDLNARQAVFVFAGDGELGDLVADFNDGCAQVEPREYQKALTWARRKLFAYRDRRGQRPV